MRFGSRLAGKRKPRPGLGVGPFSPKQPAARRRRWRQAHFGTTGLKACPFAAYLSFCERWPAVFLRWVRWGRPLVLACVTEKVPPADLIPCGGKNPSGLRTTGPPPGGGKVVWDGLTGLRLCLIVGVGAFWSHRLKSLPVTPNLPAKQKTQTNQPHQKNIQ